MFRVAEFRIDPHRFELLRDGERVDIQPRAFKLLLRLIEARGALVGKEELFASVWDGRIVSESALSSQVKLLRKVLNDTERPYRIVETVHGQGLRIAAEIRRESGQVKGAPPSPPSPVLTPQADGRPSIAVLPLLKLNDAAAYPALPDAIPDEIITALSKLRWLRVCARGSSFRYPSFGQTARDVGAQLDVGYCVAGSIEYAGASIRLAFELADATSDTVIWRDNFTLPVEGIFELRQEIVAQIASRIEEQVSEREIEGLRGKDPASIAPWQAFHLGYGKVFATGTPDPAGAKALFERAIEGDSGFARAHAGLAQVHYWSLFQKQASDEEAAAAIMRSEASQALALDRHDPFCQLMAGRSHLILHRIEEGLEHLEMAKAIAPSYALAYSGIGSVQAMIGKPSQALANFETALKLSPQDPWKPHMLSAMVIAQTALEDYSAAAATMRKVLDLGVRTLQSIGGAMTVFARADEWEEAEFFKREFVTRFPDKTVEDYLSSFPALSPATVESTREIFARMEIA